MYIKPHSTNNEYIRAGDVWVRNFTKAGVPALSLDDLFEDDEYDVMLKNEVSNGNFTKISRDLVEARKVVIISDGYNFSWKHLSITKFPKDVVVLAVNRSMRNWKLMSPSLPLEERRSINAYVVNNPYQECISCLPTAKVPYYPTCIASTRTNYEFLKRYLGDKYVYDVPPDPRFGTYKNESYWNIRRII